MAVIDCAISYTLWRLWSCVIGPEKLPNRTHDVCGDVAPVAQYQSAVTPVFVTVAAAGLRSLVSVAAPTATGWMNARMA